jgi:DNA-binding NarL/FixJ family response regulator
MTEEKKKILSLMSIAELNELHKGFFTFSENQEIINETILKTLDKKIAVLYVLNNYNFNEIADKLNLDVRTVSNHWRFIEKELRKTIVKLYYTKNDLFKML